MAVALMGSAADAFGFRILSCRSRANMLLRLRAQEKPTVYVNLFNNQWNTDFRLWNEGSWIWRLRLWPVGRYESEPSLITPAPFD
jgi:hypothetical protein